MTAGSTRRDWLGGLLGALPCATKQSSTIALSDVPPPAAAFAAQLGLSGASWSATLDLQRRDLAGRIAKGSAEHVTYYALQSSSFTSKPPIDPVRLAASRPTAMPADAAERFQDFLRYSPPGDARFRILRDLYRSIAHSWTPEACFAHTMAFLRSAADARADPGSLDEIYHRRGLSVDTSPSNTALLDAAAEHLPTRSFAGPALLAGPGLDLTRREGFTDALPLRSYQTEWMAAKFSGPVECMDARPEVVEFLKSQGRCAFEGDVTRDIPARSHYKVAVATNLLLYLTDELLFLALAALTQSLRPGGYLVHNDTRFAAKPFGEALGMPVVHFAPVRLGARHGVDQMDRAVVHRKTG